MGLAPNQSRRELKGGARLLTATDHELLYRRLTGAGHKELLKAEKSFERLVKGIRAVLRYA